MSEKMIHKTGIFSGRFDPPHLGHVLTGLNLLKTTVGRLVIVVLDYEGRSGCKAEEAKRIFDSFFNAILAPCSVGCVTVVINNVHFAEITFAEYFNLLKNLGICYDHSIYLSGNNDVLRNFERQQIHSMFVRRSEDWIYTGTDVRKQIGTGNLNEFYGKPDGNI